jgi:hypothetical protein
MLSVTPRKWVSVAPLLIYIAGLVGAAVSDGVSSRLNWVVSMLLSLTEHADAQSKAVVAARSRG